MKSEKSGVPIQSWDPPAPTNTVLSGTYVIASCSAEGARYESAPPRPRGRSIWPRYGRLQNSSFGFDRMLNPQVTTTASRTG